MKSGMRANSLATGATTGLKKSLPARVCALAMPLRESGRFTPLQYSAIGDVVNVAARLERANKQFEVQ